MVIVLPVRIKTTPHVNAYYFSALFCKKQKNDMDKIRYRLVYNRKKKLNKQGRGRYAWWKYLK